ncbi:hypothetical protein [Dyella nitratireducens]|uniref:Inovirus Gp2 family protein n=1 Tax=Dyella nitratireducens TaxID=1849580 RepID=A0ABQ1FKF8_9GAMM|nr:hypothetical protein [Dyella nitratireducens]GGA16475.1 hypothetical protein GCM10010981_00130 [Dyella nitratireducens]GLQ44927.1 hypothetical protein GCM10007902_47770 [Dyella nitratireducens]
MNRNKFIINQNIPYYDHDYEDIRRYQDYEQINPRIIKIQKQLIKNDIAYFGTLSFQYDIEPCEARRVASIHWRKVQKYVLGRNWIKKGVPPLTGLLVMETHPIYNKMTTQKFSGCHFHHLIYSHPKLPDNQYMAAAELNQAFAHAARGLTHKNKRWQLVSRYGTRVLSVENIVGICGYAAKEAWHFQWKWEDRISYLCKDGVV